MEKDEKLFNVRLPRELWAFIKKESYETDVSMAQIIRKLVEKHKKKIEDRLTKNNSVV